MGYAAIDASGRQTITGRLNSDGLTVTRVKVNASTHRLATTNGSGGADSGGTNSAIDDNSRQSMFAASNADGVSLVSLYVDSSGALLIKSS